MAPPSGTRMSSRIMAAASAPTMTKARKTTKTKPRRKRYNKGPVLQQQKNIQEPIPDDNMMPSNSSTTTIEDIPPKTNDLDFETTVDSCSSACSTPKAERFRIPEIVTCPPAPKKQRVLSNCSVKRSPISFFPHLDLEMFFLHASRNTSF